MGINAVDAIGWTWENVELVLQDLDNDPYSALCRLRHLKPTIRVIEPQLGFVTRHFEILLHDSEVVTDRDRAWIAVRIRGELGEDKFARGSLKYRPSSAIPEVDVDHEGWHHMGCESYHAELNREALRFARCFEYTVNSRPA